MKKVYKQIAVVLAIGVLLLLLIIAGSWLLLPYMMPDAMVSLQKQTPLRVYYDCHGALLQYERTYDYQLREPVSLDAVSKCFIDALLAIEDEHFFEHGGVSYGAVLRAMYGNATHRYRYSGASTITMQLVSLPKAGERKNLLDKLVQASMARRLEHLYSKERILEEYINRIPFGGKIYGIEAAARFYFDKPASELNLAEATLLAGIPQRPNALRPDRHFPRAKKRQVQVLFRMVQTGKLSYEKYRQVAEEPLYLRDSHKPSYYAKNYSPAKEMLLSHARHQARGTFVVKTSFDWELQVKLEEQLKSQVRKMPNVKDGAAVLLNAKTGEVMAMVGTLNFYDAADGQVNAAISIRSAGSTLKPFIYAEAIDGGLLCAETKVMDAPLRYGSYAPGNYSGSFQGAVPASVALATSLNTPAIRLMSRLGTERMLERFAEVGLAPKLLSRQQRLVVDKGLTLALGTAGHSLLQLTSAYTCFADGGIYHAPSFLAGESLCSRTIFSKGCTYMLTGMLRTRQLPGSTLDVAWKTGTSNGLHDAWCIVYTEEYVVGIWFGNKSGIPSSYLVGGKSAAPCAAAIISMLYKNRKICWHEAGNFLVEAQLCAESGLRPGSDCSQYMTGHLLSEFVLPECTACSKGGNASKLKIISPKSTRYLAENGGIDIPFQCSDEALWYVDGAYFGNLKKGESLFFKQGEHKVIAVLKKNSLEAVSVDFTVVEKQAQ